MYCRVGGIKLDYSSCHLDDENIEKLNFISSNGPHPLCSENVVEAMLTNHFGKNWHFTVMKSSFFVSQTVDRHFESAKSLPNSLQ